MIPWYTSSAAARESSFTHKLVYKVNIPEYDLLFVSALINFTFLSSGIVDPVQYSASSGPRHAPIVLDKRAHNMYWQMPSVIHIKT